jgi:hypothetical protein
LLDKLVELGLATKVDENKKFTYYPASPTSLKTLLSHQLSETEEKIATLERHLPQMLSDYHAGGEQPKINLFRGKKELEQMYIDQMEEKGRELYFVRSKADVPYFGLQKMLNIRYLSGKYGKKRVGITPINYSTATTSKKDAKAGKLNRAWLDAEEYTSDVEWAVSGNCIHAILFSAEGYGVSIEHPELAESFRQILHLLHKYIKLGPNYQSVVLRSKHNQLPDSKDKF